MISFFSCGVLRLTCNVHLGFPSGRFLPVWKRKPLHTCSQIISLGQKLFPRSSRYTPSPWTKPCNYYIINYNDNYRFLVRRLGLHLDHLSITRYISPNTNMSINPMTLSNKITIMIVQKCCYYICQRMLANIMTINNVYNK